MILDLDAGNSWIKWRLRRENMGPALHAGMAASEDALLEQLGLVVMKGVQVCRLASVRSDDEDAQLVATLSKFCPAARIVRAQVSAFFAGVDNGYDVPELLGLDRWLALLAVHHLARGKNCLLIDLGTAVTADLLSAEGKHVGGYIAPGLTLMRTQLLSCTRRIRYDAANDASPSILPGCNTRDAVEGGCLLMLRGFVQAQITLAKRRWEADFQVFLTGGDAKLVADELQEAEVCHEIVQDLVFMGLAIACPA